MKKGLSALLCLLLLTGCTNYNVNVTPSDASQSAVTSAEPGAQADGSAAVNPAELAAQAQPEAYFSAQAADAFTGPVQFVAEEAGSYRFVAAQSDEDVSWDIYALDEAFEEDGLRYLPQTTDPAASLAGDGEVELALKADQFVYCFCSQSRLNLDEPTASGDLSVYFTPASEAEQAAVRAQGVSVDLDAAMLWNEDGVYSFQASEDQSFTVTREGEDDWNVYVLDQEFDDALRYLPQANEPAVTNEGSFAVKAGQFVYCISDLNDFTADEAPDQGVSVLHLAAE